MIKELDEINLENNKRILDQIYEKMDKVTDKVDKFCEKVDKLTDKVDQNTAKINQIQKGLVPSGILLFIFHRTKNIFITKTRKTFQRITYVMQNVE